MMPELEESAYSSVATLWSLCILIFLAELNGLLMMQGDIGNAYLESYTQEKVYFIAGPELSQYAGQSCIIEKALYGLRSSGLCFHVNSPRNYASLVLNGLGLIWTCVIENAQRHFQGSLFGCFEYVLYISLSIVCTINVSIDCKKNKVSNPFTRKNILDYKSRQ